MLIKWADSNLAKLPNFADFPKTWIACELDDAGKPVKIEGVLWMVQVVDFPGFRYISSWAAKALKDRANDYLHDQGMRGCEVFVHIPENEPDEQRCPEWQEWLKAFGAVPADRYKITVV
jgi:hypothetical protein